MREHLAFLHLIPCREKFLAITFAKESETATSALDLRVTRCLIRNRYTQDIMRKQTEVRNGCEVVRISSRPEESLREKSTLGGSQTSYIS